MNLGNIYGTINQIVQQFNFLQDAKRNYPMMMKLLANVNSRLTITNQGIKLLSATYAEVAKNHSMYSNSLCYLDTMTTPRISMSYSRVIKCTSLKGRVDMCHFTSWMTHVMRKFFQSTSCTSRTWSISNIAWHDRMMRRIEIQQETWSAGSVTTSSDLAKRFMIMKYKDIENSSMRAKSTSCRTRRLGYDSPTSDTRCQHRSSCTLTSSQPLMTRTNTSPSCYPV